MFSSNNKCFRLSQLKATESNCTLFTRTTIVSTPILANEIELARPEIVEVESDNPHIRNYKISDGNEALTIAVNYETFEAYIDGELIPFVTEYLASPNATVNYSTGINLSYHVPWQTTATLTAGVIMALFPGIGTGIADAIVNAVANEGPDIYVTCTQYRSVEQYYSSYAGVYYNKAINMNIRAYKYSVAPANLFYGPVNGSWFDPVRPY